jgi:hypothetical protein
MHMQLSKAMALLQNDAVSHEREYDRVSLMIDVPVALAAGDSKRLFKTLDVRRRTACDDCGCQPGPRFVEVLIRTSVAGVKLYLQPVKQTALKLCTGCGMVSYCNSECQNRGWRAGHKAACKPLGRIRGHLTAAAAAQEAAVDCLPHVHYVRCMLPNLASDRGHTITSIRGNLTQSLTLTVFDVGYLMAGMRDAKGPRLNTSLPHSVVNELNLLRVYTPTQTFVDTGDNLDEIGHLLPDSRVTRCAWGLKPRHAAKVMSEMRRCLGAVGHQVRPGDAAEEELETMRLLRLKRARGFTHVYVESSHGLACGIWYALEQRLPHCC